MRQGEIVEDRYRIEDELGQGAMGVVYRARHVRVGRAVAVKVLHDHLVSDPSMVARFEREALVAAKLAHKNVAGVLDVGEGVIVMELAEGRPLADVLFTEVLDRDRVINLVRQLLEGLAHAHGVGLVHRDLKPENVIVERDDHGVEVPRIVDFGIAVLRDAAAEGGRRLTEHGVVLGTPAYMAPEQAHGDAPDPRNDLFALGVMLYEMLAGKPPFDGGGVEVILANIRSDPPSILRRSGRDVDPLLEQLAKKLMARALSDRFATARAALDALALIETDRGAAERALRMRRRSVIPKLTTVMPAEASPSTRAPTVALRAPTAPAPRPRLPVTWAIGVGALLVGIAIGMCA